MKLAEELKKVRGVKRLEKGIQADFPDENLNLLKEVQVQISLQFSKHIEEK